METYNIQGVEVFAVGTWNGDEYTSKDLQDMVIAFEETKSGIPPYLKLGHDNNQNLIQNDGLPAIGWVERLYIKGDKLVADFSNIPKKIFELITSKAYRKVSSEIYWNLKIKDKTYNKLLGAVALLGADTPGVMNLTDILSYYKLFGENQAKTYTDLEFELKSYTQNFEGVNAMTEEEKQKLEQEMQDAKTKAEQLEQEIAQQKASNEGLVQELEQLKQFKAEAEQKALQDAIELKKKETENFIKDLVTSGDLPPSCKNFAIDLLGDDKKEYSLEDKSVSKAELFKEFVKLFSKSRDVNLDENSTQGDETAKNKIQETEEKIKAYMSEKNVNYSTAYKAILNQQKGE